MHSIDDIPSDSIVANASSVWTKPKDQCKHTLNLICGSIVDKYISFSFNDGFKSSSDQVCLLIQPVLISYNFI